MSNPELAIAKVNFSAVLFRKDPTPLTRPEIEAFHALLADTIAQCSPSNVQKCRRWILDNLRPSPARIAGLAKYLVALSGSFGAESVKARPSARRRQLHVLYLLNDVLYDSTTRHRDDIFARELEGSLVPLFHNAANFQNCPKHIKKLEGLVELWGEQRYYPATVIDGLRDTIKEAPLGGKVFKAPIKGASATTGQIQASRTGKDAPYVVPSMHGDPSTPWYDLPAGNWLPHLTPNSTKPMHPEDIKPLHLAPGPADKALAQAVKDLLKDVERIYSRGSKRDDDPDHIVDLNELGERVIIDEVTGDIIGGETYYGWSRGFCEKMRARKQKAKQGGPGRGRAPSRSPSVSSRSPSPPPAHKRRRLSRDASSSRSRSRSRHGRGRQYSRSRSRSPPRRYRSRSPSRTRTFNSRNRSPSPPRHGRPPLGSSNPSRTPSAPPPAPVPHHQHIHGSIPPFPPPPPMHGGFAQFTPPPPPPPPQGYQGGWAHLPPPPGQQQPGWLPPPPPHLANQGGWQPPPPPDFQQQHQGQGQGQYQQYGRAGHNRGGRGRGGYDRGRGW